MVELTYSLLFMLAFVFITKKKARKKTKNGGAMKMKVRERWDNITLRLFKSKLNEIHLDSQASQVITGGDFFSFFSFPWDWFLTRCRKAWKSLSHNHFGLRQEGSRWRKRRWARPAAIHHHVVIYFSRLFWMTSFVDVRKRKFETMNWHVLLPNPENSCCRAAEEEEFSDCWNLIASIFILKSSLTTPALFLSCRVNKTLKFLLKLVISDIGFFTDIWYPDKVQLIISDTDICILGINTS